MHILTKSKIVSGLQCHRKLWFDVNDALTQDSHIFYIGNRFGNFAREHYGHGLNLTGQHDTELALQETTRAINDKRVNVIYEAAFVHEETLVRPDVLLRIGEQWEIVEIKSSTSVKPEHITDAAIQAYVIRSQGVNITSVKVGHINNTFIYKGDGIYDNFLVEVTITEEVQALQDQVASWINELKPLGSIGVPSPTVKMGAHCAEPYKCPYQHRCIESLPKSDGVPISILPTVGKKLAMTWAQKGVRDLRELPPEALANPLYRMIQKAHQANITWIDPILSKKINAYTWPRFFMDFETVQQGIPLLTETKAFDALPFQWSVHRWDYQEQKIDLEDGFGYLEFFRDDMARTFLTTLLKTVGSIGPIFVHNASFERSKLRALVARQDSLDLKPDVESLIERIVDTLELAREGFYAPIMMGSFSLKDIVKAIPTTVDYENEEALSGGGQAQIVWFKCTDPATSFEEKKEWTRRLIRYCAQDTLAMYHLLLFVGNSTQTH